MQRDNHFLFLEQKKKKKRKKNTEKLASHTFFIFIFVVVVTESDMLVEWQRNISCVSVYYFICCRVATLISEKYV